MPVIKANQPLPQRYPVILLYGEPGISKTSIGNTCEVPLLLDFDKGVDRSILRKDTLPVNDWEDILAEESAGTFSAYKTVVIDTAKAALDDYLMNWVVRTDYKLKTNKLGMYGAVADSFKIFVNNRRRENVAILIIAHSRKDEDSKKFVPDVTGGSYQLLLRIADQVGFISIKNGRRTIQFEPSEHTVGKNVACLPEIVVPDKASEAFKTFGASLFQSVKDALSAMSEEQREAMEKSTTYQEAIGNCTSSEAGMLGCNICELPDYLMLPLMQRLHNHLASWIGVCEYVGEFNNLFASINELPDRWKHPLRHLCGERGKAMGWIANKETKLFEDPKAKANGPTEQLFAAPQHPGPDATFDQLRAYQIDSENYEKSQTHAYA